MSALLDARESYVRNAALAMLLIASFATAIAAVMHRLQEATHPLDLWLPTLMSISFGLLFLVLKTRPSWIGAVLWLGLGTALTGILVPIWWYTWEAAHSDAIRLVDTLPPIGTTLIPIVLSLAVFMRPRVAMIAAAISWALVAGPILGYLFWRTDELLSPRGQDLLITLGPVMMLVLVFIPVQRGLQQRVASLHAERVKMQALAERDVLTGLYNRRAGESFLRAVMGGNANVELALLDIDRFKSINDTHGHAVGDAVLREIAERCSSRLRRDDIVARWGGEEFLVLTQTASHIEVGQIAEELRTAIAAEPIPPVGKVTASFGVTRMHDGDTMASLLERADEALYAAKHGGRDRVVCR